MRLVILATILALFLIACTPTNVQENETQDPVEISARQLCEASGGSWEEYPNSCADNCDFVRSPETYLCAQAFTNACNCGEDMCWNGESCEPNNIELDKSDKSQDQVQCEQAGGEWKEFPNSCVDSCDLARNPEAISCAFALTQGCECGPLECWNGNTCERN